MKTTSLLPLNFVNCQTKQAQNLCAWTVQPPLTHFVIMCILLADVQQPTPPPPISTKQCMRYVCRYNTVHYNGSYTQKQLAFIIRTLCRYIYSLKRRIRPYCSQWICSNQTRIRTHFYLAWLVCMRCCDGGFSSDFMLPTVKNIWQQYSMTK